MAQNDEKCQFSSKSGRFWAKKPNILGMEPKFWYPHIHTNPKSALTGAFWPQIRFFNLVTRFSLVLSIPCKATVLPWEKIKIILNSSFENSYLKLNWMFSLRVPVAWNIKRSDWSKIESSTTAPTNIDVEILKIPRNFLITLAFPWKSWKWESVLLNRLGIDMIQSSWHRFRTPCEIF